MFCFIVFKINLVSYILWIRFYFYIMFICRSVIFISFSPLFVDLIQVLVYWFKLMKMRNVAIVFISVPKLIGATVLFQKLKDLCSKIIDGFERLLRNVLFHCPSCFVSFFNTTLLWACRAVPVYSEYMVWIMCNVLYTKNFGITKMP